MTDLCVAARIPAALIESTPPPHEAPAAWLHEVTVVGRPIEVHLAVTPLPPAKGIALPALCGLEVVPRRPIPQRFTVCGQCYARRCAP